MNLSCDETTTLICISGHTHYSHDYIRNNVRYISNQLGYYNEATNNDTLFNDDGLYELL